MAKEFKIFFSWQSDLSANQTTRFIEESIAMKCEGEFKCAASPFVIVKAIEGVLGMIVVTPPIPRKMWNIHKYYSRRQQRCKFG